MELASSGLPEGAELAILETVRDKVPAEVFTKPYTNPVGRQPRERSAPICARRRGCCARPATRSATTKLVNTKTGEPFTVEVLIDQPGLGAPRAALQAVAGAARHPDDAAHRRRRAVREPAAAVGLRHDRRDLGPVAVARQRAARLLELEGRRPAGLAQSRRHQESGGRYADRAADLRHQSRRPRRRHQGARSRAAVESLRRAAMDLRQDPQRALGSLSAVPTRCRNTASRHSRPSGGGTRPRRPRQGRARDRTVAPEASGHRRRRRRGRRDRMPAISRNRPATPNGTACRRSAI